MKVCIRKIRILLFVLTAASAGMALAHQSVPSAPTEPNTNPKKPYSAQKKRLPLNILGSSTSNWSATVLSLPEAFLQSTSESSTGVSETIGAASNNSQGSSASSGDSSPFGPVGGALNPNTKDYQGKTKEKSEHFSEIKMNEKNPYKEIRSRYKNPYKK